jgi:hypothetical protein
VCAACVHPVDHADFQEYTLPPIRGMNEVMGLGALCEWLPVASYVPGPTDTEVEQIIVMVNSAQDMALFIYGADGYNRLEALPAAQATQMLHMLHKCGGNNLTAALHMVHASLG